MGSSSSDEEGKDKKKKESWGANKSFDGKGAAAGGVTVQASKATVVSATVSQGAAKEINHFLIVFKFLSKSFQLILSIILNDSSNLKSNFCNYIVFYTMIKTNFNILFILLYNKLQYPV